MIEEIEVRRDVRVGRSKHRERIERQDAEASEIVISVATFIRQTFERRLERLRYRWYEAFDERDPYLIRGALPCGDSFGKRSSRSIIDHRQSIREDRCQPRAVPAGLENCATLRQKPNALRRCQPFI